MNDADFKTIVDRIRSHSDQLPAPDRDALTQAALGVAPGDDQRRVTLVCLDVLREIAMLRSSSFEESVITTMRGGVERESLLVDGIDLVLDDTATEAPRKRVRLNGSEAASWICAQISHLQGMLSLEPRGRQGSLTQEEWIAEVDVIFSVLDDNDLGVSPDLFEDKMYQAWALANILLQLHAIEGFSFRLVNGTRLQLKETAGPIDQSHPHFEGESGNRRIALWSDVSFRSRRSQMPDENSISIVVDKPRSLSRPPSVDIAVVSSGTDGHPSHDDLLWAVASSRVPLQEDVALSAIHLRDALSRLAYPTETFFRTWPATHVPAEPPVAITIFSTGLARIPPQRAGEMFGISFEQLGLPI